MTPQRDKERDEDQGVSDESQSYIRYRNMNSKIDDLTELLETIINGIQALKLRHLIVIAFLFSLFLGYIGYNWILAPENRAVLINIAGRSRLVGVIDNCPVVKVPFEGSTKHVIFLNYFSEPGDSRFVAAVFGDYDTAKIIPVCRSLFKDQLQLIEDKKSGIQK